MKFSNNELAELVCKFDLENIENLGLLLHFAGFSGDTREIVERLQEYRIFAYYNGVLKTEKLSLISIFKSFNEKEMCLFSELLDEAEMCASSDERYTEYSLYFNDMRDLLETELGYKQIKKNK